MFAWEYVNIVVTSRCFAFRTLITPAWIWKRFRVEKLNKFTLAISSLAQPWKIFRNMLCQFFFALADILKTRILESIFFCKTRTDYTYKLCVQNFATGKNFSFNQCSKQEGFAFFLEKLFYKSNRKLFYCVCISWYKHSKSWENSRQLCKPSTLSQVCITVSNSPNPSRVSIRLCKHGKRFLLLKFITLICVPYISW